jgi:regulator of RNase E activity RraB
LFNHNFNNEIGRWSSLFEDEDWEEDLDDDEEDEDEEW